MKEYRRVAYKVKGALDDTPSRVIHLIREGKRNTTWCGIKARGKKWVIDYDPNIEVNCKSCLRYLEEMRIKKEKEMLDE